VVAPHHWVCVPGNPKGYKYFVVCVKGQGRHKVEVLLEPVALPPPAPAGAVGYRVIVINLTTGKRVTYLNPPFAFSRCKVYAYLQDTGTYSQLHKNSKGRYESHTPQLFALACPRK